MDSSKTSNKNARRYVQQLLPFRGSNTFGRWEHFHGEPEAAPDSVFVVCSYTPTWPMFAYSPLLDRWFENSDKYSRTTSRHQSQLRPHRTTTTLPAPLMRSLATLGGVAFVATVLQGATP